ncbi:MAG TPA: methyltransferase domain-containing protein [Acidimicrobiales bacterium]|jgi:27-O-demethylrifamycin SV methyltransferase|nr:methyltransferase domain-containing protein [Acidimicrobiales bacterium]
MGTDNTDTYAPAAHYDRVHRSWELIMGEEFHYGFFATAETPLEQATEALTQAMLDRAGLRAGERVLDVGCGTGRQACDLVAGLGVTALGITTSASGVAAAAELAAGRHLAGAVFEQRDGTDNGLDDASFDVVWVLESSHLMRDKPALLRECVRVLAPGGRVVLCDIIRKRDIPFLEVRERREDFGLLRRAFGDAHMEPLDDYTTCLAGLGMTITDASDISLPTLPTFAAWRANVETHEESVRQLIGDAGVHDFVESTHVLEGFWKDETLGYGILAAVKGH